MAFTSPKTFANAYRISRAVLIVIISALLEHLNEKRLEANAPRRFRYDVLLRFHLPCYQAFRFSARQGLGVRRYSTYVPMN
jgi:hypothetical protein